MRIKRILLSFSIFFLSGFFFLVLYGNKKGIEATNYYSEEFESCTSILVTKGASVDGSLMTTHSCDGSWEFRLKVVPSKTHKPGEIRPIYKGGGHGAERKQAVKVGEIPEVKQTFSRFDIAYPFINEKQLAIGESTFGGRRELYNPEGMFDIMALQRIVLERTSTAREAIKLMGELVTKYGYSDFGECLTLIDTKEAWVFEIIGAGPLKMGAIWAARRVPDGEVFVTANRSRIEEVNLDDKDNFMASDNVFQLAEEKGWYDSHAGKPFKFNESYAPSDSIGCRRREWRVLSTIAPSLKLDPWSEEYPFSVKPDKKVSIELLKSLHRDYYKNTEFDPSQGLASGPFHNPNRFATWTRPPKGYIGWERPISIFRCSYCFIAQTRDWLPDWIGGLAWFVEDDPKTGCFVPFYCGIKKVPECYQIGRRDEFNRKSAWWAFDFVSNWANLRYSHIVQDIQKAYTDFENSFSELQSTIETRAKTLYKENPKACRDYLTRYCNETSQRVVDDWWALSEYLIIKYNDGYINQPQGRITTSYPKEWLDAVGYGRKKLKKR